jgi:hypothetical protein
MLHIVFDVPSDFGFKVSRRVARPSILFPLATKQWVPRPCAICKGGLRCCPYIFVCHACEACTRLTRGAWEIRLRLHFRLPPFAKNAKDGAPALLVMLAR